MIRMSYCCCILLLGIKFNVVRLWQLTVPGSPAAHCWMPWTELQIGRHGGSPSTGSSRAAAATGSFQANSVLSYRYLLPGSCLWQNVCCFFGHVLGMSWYFSSIAGRWMTIGEAVQGCSRLVWMFRLYPVIIQQSTTVLAWTIDLTVSTHCLIDISLQNWTHRPCHLGFVASSCGAVRPWNQKKCKTSWGSRGSKRSSCKMRPRIQPFLDPETEKTDSWNTCSLSPPGCERKARPCCFREACGIQAGRVASFQAVVSRGKSGLASFDTWLINHILQNIANICKWYYRILYIYIYMYVCYMLCLTRCLMFGSTSAIQFWFPWCFMPPFSLSLVLFHRNLWALQVTCHETGLVVESPRPEPAPALLGSGFA